VNPPVAFGNLGIGEIALVLAAVLFLFGIPNGVVLRRRTEWHAELRRQYYLVGWILAGLAAGLASTSWTAPLRLGIFEAAAGVAGGLVLVATVAIQQPQGVRRALTALSAAAFALSWGVATDVAAHWPA
jgi:hypothetical protein